MMIRLRGIHMDNPCFPGLKHPAYLCSMGLEQHVMGALKEAMKAKDQAALRALRAIKQAILLFNTSGTNELLDETAEVRILQKLIKQRKESAQIFHQQSRPDLAIIEEEEIEVIIRFLPQQLSPEELKEAIQALIQETGANGMKDMGRLIGAANQRLGGRAEGKAIADCVKNLLQAI